MNTYWLLRDGGQVEGPFLQSQLHLMWGKGLIAAADQICQTGTDEWQALPALLGEPVVVTTKAAVPAPEKPAPKEHRTHKFTMLTGVIVLTVALVLIVYAGWWFYGQALGLKHVPDLKEVMQAYVGSHFADRKPEVVNWGIPLEWSGGKLRLIPVRWHNQVGATTISWFVLQLSPHGNEVVAAWEREDWLDRFRDTPTAKEYHETVEAISLMLN